MIGGWQSYIKQQEKAMFGRQRDGSLIEDGFITATIAAIILEHKEKYDFYPVFFGVPVTRDTAVEPLRFDGGVFDFL